MNLTKFQTSNLKPGKAFSRYFALVGLFVFFGAVCFLTLESVSAQSLEKSENVPPTLFKVGERLTYSVTFGKIRNAGFAEIETVSRGKLSGKDAVELHSKFKTNELVSAAFYLLDESRTTFAAADSGLPLYIRKTLNAGVVPKETVINFLTAPVQNFDLLTLIYHLRNSGGTGSFLLQEDEKIYAVNALNSVSEKVKTDAGDFDTTISTVQSEYFTERGLKDFRINFSGDERKIPVLIRFKTAKGEFSALLASIQNTEPEVLPTVTPTPVLTPTPSLTPTATPTPTPSLDNQPLSTNLPFILGETLEYKITSGNQPVGTFLLQAKERKKIDKKDVLFLEATVTKVENGVGIFKNGDSILAQVNAESLAPYQFEVRMSGTLSSFNQIVNFDQQRGFAISGGANQVQIPLNTHSLLSLAYAIRSFNLKPSFDKNNPINDTRVSVFYDKQFYIFTLHPQEASLLNVKGEKVTAQLITIVTGNPQLDALNLRVWLSNDDRRIPLRFGFGTFQADLISQTLVIPK